MLARRSQQASDFTKSDASFGGPAKMIPDEPSRPAAIPRHEVYHMVAAELVHEPTSGADRRCRVLPAASALVLQEPSELVLYFLISPSLVYEPVLRLGPTMESISCSLLNRLRLLLLPRTMPECPVLKVKLYVVCTMPASLGTMHTCPNKSSIRDSSSAHDTTLR